MFRNFILILLVALLPIRSWASETMGLRMIQPNQSMKVMVDVDDNQSHCELMLSESINDSSKEGHQSKNLCDTCSLCMALAYFSQSKISSVNHFSYQAVPGLLPIDSVSLALPLKPPIL